MILILMWSLSELDLYINFDDHDASNLLLS